MNREDPLDPHNLEQLRRSVVMVRPGQPAPIDPERVIRFLEELQRLQRQQREVADQLRAVLAALDERL